MAPVGSSLNRQEVSLDDIESGLEDIKNKLFSRLKKKGFGSYASRHEILGIITEEYLEAVEAVRDNSVQGFVDYTNESMDVAVAGLFGYICMRYGYIRPKE